MHFNVIFLADGINLYRPFSLAKQPTIFSMVLSIKKWRSATNVLHGQ